MLYTNLKLLRKAYACSSGMGTLIASLPKTQTEAKQISLAHILKSNGLAHAIWALRATTVDARKYAARMSIDFASECLANFEKVYPDDKRPRFAVEAAGLFLDGKITLQELGIAMSAAMSAESAARSAESAARSAESAARSARSAWSAAESAMSARSAMSAAESAARSAAMSAWSAAESAMSARSAMSAAESAARSAAMSAWSAAWSAAESAMSARSAAQERNAEIFLKWIRKAKP